MRPELVRLLSHVMPAPIAQVVAPTWFTCVGLAGLVTLVMMLRAARPAGIDRGTVASAILWGYLAAVIAGIAVPAAIDTIDRLVRHGRLAVGWGGMTSFWGYLAGLAAVALVARRAGVSLARLGDLAATPLGVALFLARLGCFVAGCDYGKVTSGPWAVRFPAGSPAWRDQVHAGLVPPGRAESLPVHPTQLYEALLGITIAVIAAILARSAWGRARSGGVILAAVATYAVGRLGVECLRGDVGRGFFGPLSSGQVFSLGVLAVVGGAALWTRRRRAVALAGALPLATALAADEAHADDLAGRGHAFDIGLLAGVSAPLNRRGDQVPPTAGPTLSIAWRLPSAWSVWLDVDSLRNDDATHGTALVSLGFDRHLPHAWTISPRVGLGSTLVNFDEPAFRDVAGLTIRAEANFELAIGDHWRLWARPLSLDFLGANDLGGPILAWQVRVGFAYEHRRRGRPPQLGPTRPPPPATTPAPAPAPAAPTDPYP